MFRPRPVSAGGKFAGAADGRGSSENRIEQELLRKIGLLAKHHARNVQALNALRGISTPPTAWVRDADVPPPRESVSPAPIRRRAASNDESNLNGTLSARQPPCRAFTKVTTLDRRSSRNEPTVVVPFRGMETHATAWKRKMRKIEEQDLQVKKEKEERKCRDRERFVAAINGGKEFSGVIARSNEMVERRRQQRALAEEKEEQVRRSREFKAIPFHIADEDWQTIQNRQTVRRNQRVQMRKELIASMSHLPRRMAMHALKQKAAAVDTRERAETSEDCTRFRSVSPERIREVLSRRQRQWDRQLLSAKRTKKPVVPQVLPMEEREKLYRQRAQERAKRKKDKDLSETQRSEEELRRRRQKAELSTYVPVVPRTTQKHLAKTARMQAKRKQESERIKREEHLERVRRRRQQEAGKSLAEVMRRIDRQQGRLSRRETDEEAQQKAKESLHRYRRALQENRTKLDEVARDAPTLWERHDAEVRKQEAKRIALSTIAERVFGASLTGAEREVWRGSAAEKIFDEEERAVLGISSF